MTLAAVPPSGPGGNSALTALALRACRCQQLWSSPGCEPGAACAQSGGVVAGGQLGAGAGHSTRVGARRKAAGGGKQLLCRA